MRLDKAALREVAEGARANALHVAKTPRLRWQALALVGVAFVLAAALRRLFAPFFVDTSMFGFRDWDHHLAYLNMTVVALKRYHELPFWHPWFCGGFPSWAYVEGAANLVSPYLPLYLLFPVQIAARLEVILSTVCAFAFTYLLAGRLTKSAAIRALVSVAYSLNGRWVMQFGEGHLWHLQYAWLPLALYFLDVSLEAGKRRWALGAGGALAMMAYMGGIYPLPHTALVLLLYAGILAAAERKMAPLWSLAIAGASAVGFAAPKLFPLVDLMMRIPRKVDSPEAIGLGQLLSVFTEPTGTVDHDPPVSVPVFGWYEYGIYVGVWVTAAMVLSVLSMTERGRAGALRATGIIFLVLGCGSFHKYAPWSLLHQLPAFSSQHVPSRFLFPAVLLLMLAFAGLAGRLVDRFVVKRPWADLPLLVPVYLIAMNIAAVGLLSTKEIFMFKGPPVTESAEFHHVSDLTYRYDPDWKQTGRQMLLAMFANTGVIRCYYLPSEVVPGAIAQGAPGYRGEAYVVGGGAATARVTEWTPNTATVRYEGAQPGATLVYNMNYDPSWRADGRAAIEYQRAVGVRVESSAGEVKFRYYPRTLLWGVLAFAITVFVSFGGPRRARRWWERRRGA